MIAAIATFPAVATSQSLGNPPTAGQELNNQIQLGDVISGQTLHVVSASDGVSAQANSVGNAVVATGPGADLQFTSSQSMQGNTRALVSAVADNGATPSMVVAASATANTGNAATNGATVSGTVVQTVAPGMQVTADAYPGTGGGPSTGVSTFATALGNTQGWAAISGAITSSTTQTESGLVHAYNQATVCCTTDASTYNATSVANNVTADTTSSTAYLAVAQMRDQGVVEAGVVAHQTSGTDITAASIATANNINAAGSGDWITLQSSQSNGGDVNATSALSTVSWSGVASSSAYAMANSALVSNSGMSAELGADQTNSGNVSAQAGFTTTGQGVGSASATAVGNAASVYACGACGVGVGSTSHQTNSGGVNASASVTGAGGRATGSASAVGNNLTIQVKSN